MTVLTRALHAEWTKLRTVQSSGWLLLAVIAGTLGLGALVLWSANYDGCVPPDEGTCDADTARIAFAGVYVGQVAAVLFGCLVVSSEYATGTIRSTFAAVPRRWATYVAKTAVVLGPVLIAATLAVGGSLLLARAVLPANGFTAAHGFPILSLADSTTLRAGVGTVLYLCLVALLSVGIAQTLRNTGAAIAVTLSLLFLFPIAAGLVTNLRWREWLTEWAPMTAGLSVQQTRALDTMVIGPWQGLAVLAGYAAAALLVGGLLLQFRDA